MRRCDAVVALAIVVAVVLRLVRLDAAPLWFDETFTADWVARSWPEMLRAAVTDNHPPLYFVVLKAWAAVAGTTTWALRFPGAVLSAAVVPLVAASARLLVGARAARWAAWGAALSPMLLHHGQEARMYPLVAVLAAAHLLLLARYLAGRTPVLGLGFVALGAALVASHYYAVFFLGGEVLALVLLRPAPARAWLPAAAGVTAAGGAALAAAALLARHSAGGEYAMGMLAVPGVPWAMVGGYELLPSSAALHADVPGAVRRYLPVAAVGAAAFAVLALAGLRAADRRARAVLLAALGAAFAGPFAVRLVLGVGVNPRYFIAALPALLVLLAAGAPAAATERARVAAAGVLGAVMALAVGLHLADPGHGREDVRAAGAWLAANVPPGEEIVVTSSEMAHLARFHWPERRFRLYPEYGTVAGPANADELAEGLPLAGGERAFYMIGRAWTADPSGALREALSRRFADCGGTTVAGIQIRCLARADRRHASQ